MDPASLGTTGGVAAEFKDCRSYHAHLALCDWLGWGAEFYFFCNDSYAPTLGVKRDAALGVSARKVWEEIWSDIGPRTESVVWTVEATWDESLLLFLERSGYAEETYHTFSYSPVPNDDNSIGGMLCVVTEETERAIGGAEVSRRQIPRKNSLEPSKRASLECF